MDPLALEPYAARLRWRFPEAQPLANWQALFAAFLDELGWACTAAGRRVIGHIKGLALLPGGGFLCGSKVSPHYPPDMEISGATADSCAELELDLNVLVFGLPLSEAGRIVPEVGQAQALRWGAELEVLALPVPSGAEGSEAGSFSVGAPDRSPARAWPCRRSPRWVRPRAC